MITNSPRPSTPLELSSAALHSHTRTEPHPDSEEATRYESRRVSRELSSLYSHDVVETHLVSQATPSFASLRSRNAGSATTSYENLQRQTSSASTVPDVPDVTDNAGGQSLHASLREVHWYAPFVKFWSTHVCPAIDEGAFRDHLALERTFLGYLRTSLILLMTGVLIAQLFRLQRAANPDPVFGFYVVGKSLSITFISMAIMVVLVGAMRFWRLQSALMRGKALVGGWEVFLVMGSCVVLLVATFAVVLGVTIDKAMEGG